MVSPSKRKLPSQLDRGRNINATTALAGRYKIRDLVLVAVDHIKPHPRNARTHSKKQIRQIADSIQAVGFASPMKAGSSRRDDQKPGNVIANDHFASPTDLEMTSAFGPERRKAMSARTSAVRA